VDVNDRVVHQPPDAQQQPISVLEFRLIPSGSAPGSHRQRDRNGGQADERSAPLAQEEQHRIPVSRIASQLLELFLNRMPTKCALLIGRRELDAGWSRASIASRSVTAAITCGDAAAGSLDHRRLALIAIPRLLSLTYRYALAAPSGVSSTRAHVAQAEQSRHARRETCPGPPPSRRRGQAAGPADPPTPAPCCHPTMLPCRQQVSVPAGFATLKPIHRVRTWVMLSPNAARRSRFRSPASACGSRRRAPRSTHRGGLELVDDLVDRPVRAGARGPALIRRSAHAQPRDVQGVNRSTTTVQVGPRGHSSPCTTFIRPHVEQAPCACPCRSRTRARQ